MRRLFIVLGLLAVLPVSAVDLPPGIITITPFQAPPLKLANLDGQTQDLSEYRGQWVFVHFWATWCGPCRREIPAIQDFVKKMEGERLGIMVINTADSEDAIFEFLAANAPELNSLSDRDGQATELWHPRGLPATYLVDPNGIVRYQALGGRPWNEEPYLSFIRNLIKG